MHKEQIDIKTAAKNLATVIQPYGVENISHSASLNMVSRILGIKDYNTFKSIDREITVFHKNEKATSKEFSFLNPKSLTDIFDEEDKRRLENYPEYDNKMVSFAKIGDDVNVFIDRELSNEQYTYYLSIALNNTITNRIYYAPKFQTISFYIYPDVKKAHYDYHIDLKLSNDGLINKTNILEVLEHVSGKNWFNMDFLHDYMEFCKYLEKNINYLDSFIKKYASSKLEYLYLQQHKE
jgi:hypothetical protein